MNTINEISIISPDNAVESCAEFFIDEPDQAYTLIDTLVDGRKYTFSCWVKALAAGTIIAEGEAFEITTEWKKIAVSFTANSTQLQIKFSPGTYHVHHPMLEIGNKASDWTPNPDDVEQEISLKVGQVDFNGKNIISKINLAPGTALIEAAHINLRGSVTISDLDDNLGSSFVTDEDGVTQIDGGNIKTGTITALGEITAGTFSLGNGNFIVDDDGYLIATEATIKGDIEATSGMIGCFKIEPLWGLNSSYFHDSDAVQYDMNLYGKLLHDTTTGYGDYVYRIFQANYKSGDPDDGWVTETDMIIGAIDDGGDGFSTLIYNSRGGCILLNEGVGLFGKTNGITGELLLSLDTDSNGEATKFRSDNGSLYITTGVGATDGYGETIRLTRLGNFYPENIVDDECCSIGLVSKPWRRVAAKEGNFLESVKSPSFQCGRVSVDISTANTPAKVSVVFDTPYTKAPTVVATPYSTVPGSAVTGVGVYNVTTTGFDIYLTRSNTTKSSVNWFAYGV